MTRFLFYKFVTVVTIKQDVELDREIIDSVKEEEFKVVSKRKRKNGEGMEAEDGSTAAIKRPSFPPVDASTTLVTIL